MFSKTLCLLVVSSILFKISCGEKPDDGKSNLLNEEALNEQLRKFDNTLYSELAKKHSDSNIILSPFSIQTCIAMSRMGASGTTAAEIDKILVSSDQNPNHLALHYYNILKNYENSAILKIANKMYVKNNIKVNEQYNKLLTEKFFSSAEALDFSNGQAAANTINSWVENKTNHLIKDLITPNKFDDNTRLVLVNAIHFKGEWVYEFDKKYTHETEFSSDKNTFKVQMMYREADFSYGFLRDLNAEAVELPYRDSDLSMMVILPRRDTNLADVEQKLKNMSLADLSNNMRVSEIEVYLPKFQAEFEVELSDTLQGLGMRRMFSRGAEFDHILAGESELHVSSIIHKAVIEVNEKGTEAAAATDAVLTPHILGVVFVANRPFHYIIKNKNTTLFEGNFKGEPKKQHAN